MPGPPEVLKGMLVRAGVATIDFTAGQAHAQMCPRILAKNRAPGAPA